MARHVLMIMPGFPGEMPLFTRGLAEVGATVWGVAQGPVHELPELTRTSLSHYLALPDLFVNEDATVRAIREWTRGVTFDRVCCLWEPGVELAGALRDALGVPGLTRAQAHTFRNKEVMKRALGDAGVRVPRHRAARSARAMYEAAEAVGFPCIIKPIAGAGSMDTFRCNDAAEFAAAVQQVAHVPEVSVEEFIDGEEFTYDTIWSNGTMHYFHIGHYRPRPLVARSLEWISPQTLSYRHVDDPWVADGRAMGEEVLRILGFDTGFTHMEWYRKSDGEVVFGEVAARPPGARTVDIMNFSADVDLFRGWAEAEVLGTFSPVIDRKYHCACITKRAQGQGTIRHIDGLDRVRARCGEAIVVTDLVSVGAPRRDWKATLLSDGYVTLRHPDWQETKDMADFVGEQLQLYAS